MVELESPFLLSPFLEYEAVILDRRPTVLPGVLRLELEPPLKNVPVFSLDIEFTLVNSLLFV